MAAPGGPRASLGRAPGEEPVLGESVLSMTHLAIGRCDTEHLYIREKAGRAALTSEHVCHHLNECV